MESHGSPTIAFGRRPVSLRYFGPAVMVDTTWQSVRRAFPAMLTALPD
jgi:hypothetical protein